MVKTKSAFLAVFLLAACSRYEPPQPFNFEYTPPEPDATHATIGGTSVPSDFIVTGILSIDGMLVNGFVRDKSGLPRMGLAFKITPGKHVVDVGCIYKRGRSRATAEIDVKPDTHYTVNCKTVPNGSLFGGVFTVLSITSDSGETVMPPQEAYVF